MRWINFQVYLRLDNVGEMPAFKGSDSTAAILSGEGDVDVWNTAATVLLTIGLKKLVTSDVCKDEYIKNQRLDYNTPWQLIS